MHAPITLVQSNAEMNITLGLRQKDLEIFTPLARTFIYLVLMHSESLEHHRLAREMYTNTL